MMTPSTTYSGADRPLSVDTPRSFTWIPPPGAPEFCWITAPATFPWIEVSTLGTATRLSSLAETVATAFGAVRRSTPVACPVTTIASRLNTSGSSVTSTVLCAAGTGTLLRLKPMRRTTRVTSPSGAATAKRPSFPVAASIVIPTTATLAPTTASPVVADVTRPVIWRCWAVALAAPKLRASARETRQERVLTVPPCLCAVMGSDCRRWRQPLRCRPFRAPARRGKTRAGAGKTQAGAADLSRARRCAA